MRAAVIMGLGLGESVCDIDVGVHVGEGHGSMAVDIDWALTHPVYPAKLHRIWSSPTGNTIPERP